MPGQSKTTRIVVSPWLRLADEDLVDDPQAAATTVAVSAAVTAIPSASLRETNRTIGELLSCREDVRVRVPYHLLTSGSRPASRGRAPLPWHCSDTHGSDDQEQRDTDQGEQNCRPQHS